MDPYEIIKEYEFSLSDDKKKKGSHYTPKEIAADVVKNTLDMLDIRVNFNENDEECVACRYGYDGTISIRICDPACGGGIFLVEAIKYIVNRLNTYDPRIMDCVKTPWGYGHICDCAPNGEDILVHITEPLDDNDEFSAGRLQGDEFEPFHEWMSGWDVRKIRKPFSEECEKSGCQCINIGKNQIKSIAKKCIFGFDIDEQAVKTTKKALAAMTGLDASAFDDNIICGDFLFDDRVTWYDAFVGNPPFLGGGKISRIFGSDYLKKLKHDFTPAKGPVDYCAYFFRRSSYLLRQDGAIGFIATNTISQGATRRAGLAQLVNEDGLVIYRADRNWKWPGTAKVTCSTVYLTNNLLGIYWGR